MRASFHNADRRLVPGMFANVAVESGEATRQITLPQTAITYNPYGNTVYRRKVQHDRQSANTVQQRFVKLGATRGDQVAVLSGVKAGEIVVVSAGQMKLRNGAAVVINNKLLPTDNPNPNAAERIRRPPHEIYRHLHPSPGARLGRESDASDLGLRSFSALQVLAYPKTENGVVTITTSFPGADPESIAGFITTPIETAVAQANGIDYMTSISQNSTSTITVNLRQNYDTSKAAAEINIKVNSVLNQLPSGALQPTITVKSRPNHRCDVFRLQQRPRSPPTRSPII